MAEGISKNVPVRVRNLIKKAGTTNPQEIAEYLKLWVKVADLPSSIDSFCVTVLGNDYICVSDQLKTAEQQRKVCRGIGHFTLGANSSEEELNSFTDELYRQLSDSDLNTTLDSYLKVS
jgi:hypothetical protein